MRLGDEVLDHLLGGIQIRDHAVLEGTDDGQIAGGTADHRLGIMTDGNDGMVRRVDGDDGRLVEDDALAANEDERVRGAEVDGEVAREHPADEVQQHHRSPDNEFAPAVRAIAEPYQFSPDNPNFCEHCRSYCRRRRLFVDSR
jgi:hypothetical protein